MKAIQILQLRLALPESERERMILYYKARNGVYALIINKGAAQQIEIHAHAEHAKHSHTQFTHPQLM